MGRPGKVTVDYFPHVTNTGKTISILEARWGNDGYSFWFKLLELLGSTNGFCYNCNSTSDWDFLLSKTRVSEETAAAILTKLAEIDAIDAELWNEKKVWCQNFVEGIEPAFERRKSLVPAKPSLLCSKCNGDRVSDPGKSKKCSIKIFPGTETGRREEIDKPEEIEEIYPLPLVGQPSQSLTRHTSSEKNLSSDALQHADSSPDHSPTGACCVADASHGNSSPDAFFNAEMTQSREFGDKKQRKTKLGHPCPSMLRSEVEKQADTVFLTPEEVDKLTDKYGYEAKQRMVDILDGYKTNHPSKCREYRDDYKVITSWVISRYLEERAKLEKTMWPNSSELGRPHNFLGKLATIAREEE